MHVRIILCLKYSGRESKKQLAVYDSDTPVILKQGQGHQTWYELVNPKQDYNNAKFQKPHLNSVCEKANDNTFVIPGNMSIISLENVCEYSGIFLTCSKYLTNLQSLH